MRRGGLLLPLLGLAACIAAPTRGHPLYVSSAPLGAEQVAVLGGYVASVDGRDVSKLGTVELLPGCHVVETPERWSGAGRPAMGALVATTGPLTFVLWMKAAHRYQVTVSAEMPTGPSGSLSVYTEETDRNATPVGRIDFIRQGQEERIVACANSAAMNKYPHGE